MEDRKKDRSAHSAFELTGGGLTAAEEAAFGAVFKTYYARLCLFAFQITGDKSLAEDICQEAFIRYWDRREGIAGSEAAVRSYLYTTVRNASVSELRRGKIRKLYCEGREEDAVEEITVVQAMIRSEVTAEIHRALETLPSGCRQVVRMAYLEGMKNKEIASKLGVSLNTVKTQRQRALQLLRFRLSPRALSLLLFCLL